MHNFRRYVTIQLRVVSCVCSFNTPDISKGSIYLGYYKLHLLFLKTDVSHLKQIMLPLLHPNKSSFLIKKIIENEIHNLGLFSEGF